MTEREHEENEAHHKERAIMHAAAHDFAHLLRDDSRHGVDRLEKCAEALGEIRNGDAIAGAEQNHHRLADDTPESEQNRGNDSGKRSGNKHPHDRLQTFAPSA